MRFLRGLAPRRHRHLVTLLAGGALLALSTATLAADAPLKDLAGGKDSPFISRFAGSTLVGYGERSFDEVQLPLTNEVNDKRFVKPQAVEGKVTRIAYLAPIGKTRVEVQRNYQEALQKAGFVKRFSCDAESCGRSRIQEPFIGYASTMKQVASYGGYSDLAFMVLNGGNESHYIWGTLKSGGRDVTVSIYLTVVEATESSPLNNRVGVFVETIEPKVMDAAQVTVDVHAMQRGLAADGRIALYGVYFDTGKAEVKPESKPQLDEMAKLLTIDKSGRFYIVGHTDNEGVADANVVLSQRRAAAIVATLVGQYHIDESRLQPRGVASFAPVASNDTEAGRARNRRVELVRQ